MCGDSWIPTPRVRDRIGQTVVLLRREPNFEARLAGLKRDLLESGRTWTFRCARAGDLS